MPVNPAPAVRALALLGRWTRIVRGHLAFGAGCSCGFGGAISVTAADLESQLVEFLWRRFGVDEAGRRWLASAGLSADGSGRIEAVLAALARQGDRRRKPEVGLDPPRARALIDQLEESIDSFEQLHGRGGGASGN
jgi:hypothetical protein